MPYYLMGDYYRGDYFRGDPGFWGSLLGIGKAALGFVPGVGPALSAGVGALTTKGFYSGAKAAPRLPGGALAAPTSMRSRIGSAILKHPVLTGAGAAGLAGGALAAEAGLARHRFGRGVGGRRHRRMRPTNPKALHRALRRAYAFERIAMRTIHLLHPKKKGRFGGFKRAKKRM